MFRKIALVIFLGMTALAVVVALKSDRRVTTNSQEAYEHYLAGVDFYEKFYLRDAVNEFEKAVALDSNFAMAQGELAMAYYSRGFHKKGKEMQELAIKNRPNVTPREQMIIDVWEQQWSSNSDSAFVLARKLAEAYPNDLKALAIVAGMEFSQDNWEQALQYYQQALRIQPDFAPAYNMLGYLNFYLGRYDDALDMLDKYLEYARDQANPHDSRGEILHATGRYEDAIAAFRQAFNINPEFDFAVTHMAASYLEMGQMSQVDYCYQILLKDSPNELKRLSYLTDYAQSLTYRDNLDSAISVCHYVIENDPQLDEGGVTAAPVVLGLIYYRQRDAAAMNQVWDSCRVYMARSIGKNPELKDAPTYERWNALMEATSADLAGDLDRSEAQFAESLGKLSRPNDKIYYRLYYADVLNRNNKSNLAISELQKNLSINPNHAPTLRRLADIYDEQGDKASAQAYREKAAEVWKNADPDFKPMLELREKLNQMVTAQKGNRKSPGLASN